MTSNVKILVVEDDTDKLRRVVECLKEVSGFCIDSLTEARDATSAKRLMRDNQYDLLILDIALPERVDKEPTRDGGIALLQEVLTRNHFLKPKHIVGLTGYSDILASAGHRFAEDLWMVIHYEPSSTVWIEQLKKKLQYIILAGSTPDIKPAHGCHLCVVTAIEDLELKAILELNWKWKELQLPHDGTIYHRGSFKKNGETLEVIAAATPRMGMTASAILSMKMISSFRPKYLAITGILAGVKGECELGDIIVADPGWDCSSGKVLVKDGTPTFVAAPYQIPLDSFLRGKLSLMAQNKEVLDMIRRTWKGPVPKTTLSMSIGPVASTPAVLAYGDLSDMIKKQHRKLIGIEMETYGVLNAAMESPSPAPKAFSIKSVSDFANEDKRDDFRKYAAYTSAAALKSFVEDFL